MRGNMKPILKEEEKKECENNINQPKKKKEKKKQTCIPAKPRSTSFLRPSCRFA